ncbi:hypothetical protein LSUE1_G000854 [Lachnellula suecica]|uniref:Hydrophobin n=1 Tax=Lachnellula suecica TaxID=602035 RepID=A0A8T9CHG6_9HELO|nr:hypothetical protein LSUE1_G000854 [Lachnellula suecica]
MQLSLISIFALGGFFTNTFANPLVLRGSLCSGLGTPQCCDISVDGILNLKRASRNSEQSYSVAGFKSVCQKNGQRAACCTLPLAGDGLLCPDA